MISTGLKKLPIADCTEEQLRAFAASVVGIVDVSTYKFAKIKELVAEAWPQDFILIAETAPAAPVPAEGLTGPRVGNSQPTGQSGIPVTSSKNDPICDIIIDEDDTEQGKGQVFVSVNGNAMMIDRGKSQAVPWRYLEVLKKAVATVINQNPDTHEFSRSEVPRYKWRPADNGRWPSKAEIDAWHKREVEKCGQTLEAA